ncbi:Uncharacterised protein [Metamycoplasma cloacale]|uniref:Uncharacterized protein n=1 Tax=Metamycoplasma cloacale TaxID=92401 RepID=A0A2Z4LMC8_9BACT|nr:hypothetical protein [Metamycoplasma cloacale]AWX42896.1 hypothetical protein DK849_02395 [Metamycoplasma cloacale]VEU79280.1 Uncharacterised protein [Metamycoplasma cloacale]
MNNDENKQENIQVKKPKNKKNIALTSIMLTTLIAGGVAVVAIPFGLNYNSRKHQYSASKELIQEKLENIVINESKETLENNSEKYTLTIGVKENNIADIVFNENKRKLETNKSFKQELPLIKYEFNPYFINNTASKLKNFWEESWKKNHTNSETISINNENDTKFFEINLFDFFSEYLKTSNVADFPNDGTVPFKVIKQMQFIEFVYTAVIEENNTYFYNDLKNGAPAFALNNYFKNLITLIEEYDKEHKTNFLAEGMIDNSFVIKTWIKINPLNNNVVESLRFQNEITLSYIKTTNE